MSVHDSLNLILTIDARLWQARAMESIRGIVDRHAGGSDSATTSSIGIVAVSFNYQVAWCLHRNLKHGARASGARNSRVDQASCSKVLITVFGMRGG